MDTGSGSLTVRAPLRDIRNGMTGATRHYRRNGFAKDRAGPAPAGVRADGRFGEPEEVAAAVAFLATVGRLPQAIDRRGGTRTPVPVPARDRLAVAHLGGRGRPDRLYEIPLPERNIET